MCDDVDSNVVWAPSNGNMTMIVPVVEVVEIRLDNRPRSTQPPPQPRFLLPIYPSANLLQYIT
ncbi:hypothetical protein M378DRAFT_167173 [Amanita muscaria Koide BX008]|uniref:Uncharacterized protein n=1 Tax=Amanita muscaria (strain Koide BX008) TaxID=946122 RepID=A0A0C2WI72_AMAMK|nr:hypothetical protein M378DRAFT_167173 [Amanita muscaria Koide BX008]